MRENIYTLGVWRVKPGRESDFVTAWKELGTAFARLPHPPADRGTLVQSLEDETLFYSFGPWKRLEDVDAMRENPQVAEGIARLHELCEDGETGAYRVVAESQ